MIYNNILEAIGHTPLIQLQKLVTPDMARVLVKFEGLNVGGSIKTRTAFNMILDAERKGLIDKNTVIVEPTSGNQGIGLALIGAVRGYRTIIIMPDSVSEERRKLVKHYGAEVKLVHDNGDIGKCIQECIDTAFYMQHMDPHVFIPQQFENPANPQIQREQTAIEILEDVDGPQKRKLPTGRPGSLSPTRPLLTARATAETANFSVTLLETVPQGGCAALRVRKLSRGLRLRRDDLL